MESHSLFINSHRLKTWCQPALLKIVVQVRRAVSGLSGRAAQDILRKFDAAHPLLKDEQIELRHLPEIERISQMRSFEKELCRFLETYRLPTLTKNRSDGWAYFLNLYARVIEDIPLVVQDSAANPVQNIDQVVVHVREAGLKTDMLFKVTWTIHDKNGQSGEVFIINSFKLNDKNVNGK